MGYDIKKLRYYTNKYKHLMGRIKGKSALIVLDIKDREAFFSLPALSRAIDELGADLNVQVMKGKSVNLDAIKDVWTVYGEMISGIKNKKTAAMKEFLEIADQKCDKLISSIFRPPEIYLLAGKDGFEGNFNLPYETDYFEEYRPKDLLKTAKVIWSQALDLKKGEKVNIGFELLRKDSELGLPIEDYLDSFQIAWTMKEAIKDMDVSMGAALSRSSQLDDPERISELKATLLGCELSKFSDEMIFKKYTAMSKLLKLDRIEVASAVFAIHGKGYSGRHYFGDCVGYPSKTKKTRWISPGQIVYRLDYYPQTRLDPRDPLGRFSFTETLPIDVFIKSCDIDWLAMQKRDHKIIDLMADCEYVEVIGKKFGKYQTKLKVGLTGDGKRRRFRPSDVETRNIINQRFFKETGIKAGTMANIPGGEAFVTPEYVEGTFIGDVVISLDRSYLLDEKKPIIVECRGYDYHILKGPRGILKKFEEKRLEGWKKLKLQEKNRSLPQEIIDLNRKNFNNIGEFAINTNPKAELCNYLIVNEKIANMIHLALGSGFDADRTTVYHTDIVINSPRQELDIYGVDKDGKKHWIHRKGKFVI